MTPRWDEKRLKYCVTVVNNKVEGDIPPDKYVGLENIESATGRHVPNGELQVIDGLANRFLKGDVLFSKLRPYLAKVMETDSDGFCTSELLVLRPKLVDRRFLFYCLLDSWFIERVNASTYGSKMPRANWEFIGDQLQVIPTPTLQRAIADYLDRKTAEIDALIAGKRRMIDLLHEKRQALISEAVTKGLDPDVPMKDSGIPWLGEIPAHWTVAALKRTARDGYRTFIDGDWIEAPYIADEGVRLLQTGNIGIGSFKEQGFRYISERTFEDLRCTEVFPGDVLVCRLDGPVGRACLAPDLGCRMITSVDVTIIKPDISHAPRFLVYLLCLRPYLDWVGSLCRVGGGHRFRISRTMLGDFLIPVPPLDEQRKLADHLDRELSRCHLIAQAIEQQIDKLIEYRQALISAAVTGKLDVPTEVAP